MNRIITLCIVLLSAATAQAGGNPGDAHGGADKPADGAYLIEGALIRLTDGRCVTAAAPGSATMIMTSIYGEPVYGDIDGDGDADAALILVYDPGGSGTFYYAAVAVNSNGRYHGTNAVLLGDRISPKGMGIGRGAVMITYLDRRIEAPMSTAPTIVKTVSALLHNRKLYFAAAPGPDAAVAVGWVIIGHEVRSFKPCRRKETLWIVGRSPALSDIIAAYRRVLPKAKPYQPVFMTLSGKWAASLKDGFGQDYDAAFVAEQFIRGAPEGDCSRQDAADNGSGGAGSKITFDLDRLDGDGLLGGPGAKRSLSYELCIPAVAAFKSEVADIDPSLKLTERSPGRVGCGDGEILCAGATHQKDFRRILERLSALPYVTRIVESVFE